MDNYKNLVSAILVKAVEDLKKLLDRKKDIQNKINSATEEVQFNMNKKLISLDKKIAKEKEFFYSEWSNYWLSYLDTTLTGEEVLQNVLNEYK